MKRALIFINGNLSEIPDLTSYKTDNSLIVCADGAARQAILKGFIPHVVIGDMDSITNSDKKELEKSKIQWISYPREKDLTDSELAVRYVVEKAVDEIYIFGLLGNRIDHMVSNLFFLSEISVETPVKLIEGNSELYFVTSKLEIRGKKGDELSLIPFHMNCEGVNTENLYYPLVNEDLPLGSTRGISNIFVKHNITISLKKGKLLVIHRMKDKR